MIEKWHPIPGTLGPPRTFEIFMTPGTPLTPKTLSTLTTHGTPWDTQYFLRPFRPFLISGTPVEPLVTPVEPNLPGASVGSPVFVKM